MGQAGAAAGKSSGVTIYLTGFTSDQGIQEYAATLKSKGQDGLVSALEKAQERWLISLHRLGGHRLPHRPYATG